MIGLRIRNFREQKGYSLTQLAKKAGISKSYLSNLERKTNTNPSLDVLSKIATALDISTNDLIHVKAKTDNERLSLLTNMTDEDFLEFQKFLEWQKLNKKNS